MNINQYFTTKEVAVTDEDFMRQAIRMADRAKREGDPAIGSLLRMTSTQMVEHDTTLSEQSRIRTASLNVIGKACETMPRRIANSILYCTVEPNGLDVLTAYNCGIHELVFGCYNLRDGFISAKASLLKLENLDLSYKAGVLAEECWSMLSDDDKTWASSEPLDS